MCVKLKSKAIRGISPLIKEKGTITLDEVEMANILKNQHSTLFSKKLTQQKYNQYKSDDMMKILTENFDHIHITTNNIGKTLAKMKRFSSPGLVGITGICIKMGGELFEDS